MYIGNYIIHCIYLFFRIYRAAVDSVDFVDSMRTQHCIKRDR